MMRHRRAHPRFGAPRDIATAVLAMLAAVAPVALIGCKRHRAADSPPAAPGAPAPAAPDARLSAWTGAVEIERAGQITPASAAAALLAGDLVRTGSNARARLAFANGQTVALGERTLLRLGRDPGSSLELTVIVGQADIEGDVKGAHGLQIKTPQGSVRLTPGGRLRVKALPDRTRYELIVGLASLTGGDAGLVTLAPGDGLSIAIGGSVLERYHIQLGATEVEQVESPEPDKAANPALPAAADTATAPGEDGRRESAPAATTTSSGVDVTLTAGETATVHSEVRTAATVRFRLPVGCATPTLRGLPRGASRGLAARSDGDPQSLLARLAPGYFAYQLICAGKLRTRGTLTIRGDTGLATLPRTPPHNRLDADGRRYTVLFQNLLPTFALSWPHPPAAAGYLLHIQARGHTRTLPAPGPTLELRSGALPEGAHTWWWTTGDDSRRSPTTTLVVRFDNAAIAAEIQSPRPQQAGLAPAGMDHPLPTIEVAGTTLPGSRVTVDERSLPLDAQGRFRADVTWPAADTRALAIRIEHRHSGVHYYLRRLAGR
jgi:hypothetical protein